MATPLVIVESPAKARTIGKFLGKGFHVEASVGHIRDLPSRASEIPPSKKKLKWARLGVDVDNDFKPLYIVPADKKAQVKKLKHLLKTADVLYLATDEDREGESISWHLLEVLKPKVPVKRLVFHEITLEAIQKALASPRDLDVALVRAQETRRIVDRLFGYEVSPLLWKKVRPKLSAGRVQSVAVRLIVERERLRLAFRNASWWDASGRFSGQGASFDADLVQVAGTRIAKGKDYGDDGKLKSPGKVKPMDEAAALKLAKALTGAPARVADLQRKPTTDRPAPPFTTSTLQQEANRKLRWTARRAMSVAQRLYETGWITYMRTDSTTLSTQAVAAARRLIASQYGREFMPEHPRVHRGKSKNAQEAHEAVRPAGSSFRSLAEAKRDLDSDQARLYELIWKRTVASQMSDAKGFQTSLRVAVGTGDDAAIFEARGKTIAFAGYRRAYVEGSDRPEAELANQERILPDLAVGAQLTTDEILPRGHQTKPPARLTEASLVKELESRGIGRPSTYASIIETILRREYVFKKGTALVPTFTAFAVTRLLEEHLSWLVDYEFTARMESDLDQIALGKGDSLSYLRGFYSGDQGLHRRLEDASDTIDPREVCTITLSEEDGEVLELRVGRYGPFLSAGEVRADVPEDLPPDELTTALARELLQRKRDGPGELGVDPDSGQMVYLMQGRFGPYVQLGGVEAESAAVVEEDAKLKSKSAAKTKPKSAAKTKPKSAAKTKTKTKAKAKPKRASLLRGMEPAELGLEMALKLLALPRSLGTDPDTDEEILALNGRYGPYVKRGKTSRSIPATGTSLLEIGMDEARELLAKAPRRRGPEPLKELGADGRTDRQVVLMSGRFGPYVTDGETNASLPKSADALKFTLEEAIELIKKREGMPKRLKKKAAPRKKAAAKKPAAKKAASRKKPAAKKPAAKKPAAKKPAAKKPAAKKPAAKAK